ncbi:hypothetical protein HN011_003381, partial [Eciton burchellii]
RLQASFGVSRNSHVWYTELENLSLVRRESIAAYIERAHVLYDNVIEAERYKKHSLAQSDINRISEHFMDEFYCGLPNNIKTAVNKSKARTPVKLYEMVETAHQRMEKKFTAHNQTFAGASRTPRYEQNRGTRAGSSYTRNARENTYNTPENDR